MLFKVKEAGVGLFKVTTREDLAMAQKNSRDVGLKNGGQSQRTKWAWKSFVVCSQQETHHPASLLIEWMHLQLQLVSMKETESKTLKRNQEPEIIVILDAYRIRSQKWCKLEYFVNNFASENYYHCTHKQLFTSIDLSHAMFAKQAGHKPKKSILNLNGKTLETWLFYWPNQIHAGLI